MFFHWMFSLLICAAFVVHLLKPVFIVSLYEKLEAWVGALNLKIIGGALLAIYLVLAIVQICLIIRRGRRADRGFITVDSSDTGRVRIAVSAIEQMVRQSVNSIDGISEMRIAIENNDDAIVIGVNASIINGCHVPTITMNMQRAIRQFVEMNCGVAVRTVAITINSVTSANEPSRRRRRGEPAMPAAAPVFTPAPQPAAEEPAAPVVSQAETAPEAPAEPDVPEIDFNYKPHLELTPSTDSGFDAEPADEASDTDDRFADPPADEEGDL